MVKETGVPTYHEILLTNNKEQTINAGNNLDEIYENFRKFQKIPENYAEWKKKPIPKAIYSMTPFMQHF